MHIETSFLCVMALLVLFFSALLYALYRGCDVKASMKVWFAQFSFETTDPSHSVAKDAGQNRSTVRRPPAVPKEPPPPA